MRKWMILFSVLLTICLLSVTAQETFLESLFGTSSESNVIFEETDDEGYTILNIDNDMEITEEDLALRLDSINEQITNASTNLTYLQTKYNMQFSLTPITTNIAIKNSINNVEYQGQLPKTRAELERLAEQINGLQNQIGDLDLTDSNVVSIKQYFDTIDENIFYALWYTGRG